MPTPSVQIYPTSGSGYVDYSSYLYLSAATRPKKTQGINQPQTMEFALEDGKSAFTAPESGNRVKFSTPLYPNWFTGYLVSDPERSLLGADSSGNPVYGYKCKASDETLALEWKTASYFPTLPPFVNKYQGQIISEIISVLGSSITTTDIDNGALIPYFRVKPEDGFWDVVRRLSDNTNMSFWVTAGAAHYHAFSTTAFPETPDEADSNFNPRDLQVSPIEMSTYNDVVAVAQVEPQAYVREHFIGDGFSATFPLKIPMYGQESSKLLEDQWTESTLDTSKWLKTDPSNLFSFSLGGLYMHGTGAASPSHMTANQGIELGGSLILRAGRIAFNAASNCRVGGLYSADTGLDADSLAVFKCMPSGSQTQITVLIGNVDQGVSYTTVSGKTYDFVFRVNVPELNRWRREYFSLTGSFSSAAVASDGIISYEVVELTNDIPEDPKVVISGSATVTGLAEFAYYTALAGPSNATDSVDAVLNFTDLSKGIQAQLFTKKTTDSAYVLRALGGKFDPLAYATVEADASGHSLKFFADKIPDERELIKLFYRSAGQAKARVKKTSSITSEAAKAGDDGVRSGVLPKITPEPRDASELETAIQAYIDDHTVQRYEGSWRFTTVNYTPASEPIPGEFITVNATSRYASFSALVTQVESTYIKWDSVDSKDIIQHAAKFGPIKRLDLLERALRPTDNALIGPFDSVVEIPSLEYTGISSAYADNVPQADYDGTITSSTVEIDAGRAPTSSFEVRKTDVGWGTSATANSIGSKTTQTFTVPRDVRDTMAWIKDKDASGNVSRYPTLVRLVYPLIPNAPTASVDDSDGLLPIITFVLPSDSVDVWGIELRDSDNATVLYKYESITLSVNNQDPALSFTYDNSAKASSFDLYLYTYNILGEYSNSYHLTSAIAYEAVGPDITGLTLSQIDQTSTDGLVQHSVLAQWDALTDPYVTSGGAIEVEWKQPSTYNVTNSEVGTQSAAINGGGSYPAWSNPTNIEADDGSNATVSLGGADSDSQSQLLVFSGFGLAIPSDAEIIGVQVDVHAEYAPTDTSAGYLGVQVGKLSGSTFSKYGQHYDKYGADWVSNLKIWRTYGSGSDMWGSGSLLTPEFLNSSNFAVAIKGINTGLPGTGGTWSTDYARVTVFYTTKNSTGLDWNVLADHSPTSVSVVLGPVVADAEVTVRVRARNKYGEVGSWASATITPTDNAFNPVSGPVPSIVQEAYAHTDSPSTSITASFGSAPTPGNLLVFMYTGQNKIGVSVVSPPAGVTQIELATNNNLGDGVITYIWVRQAQSGDGTGWTFNTSAVPQNLAAYEISGWSDYVSGSGIDGGAGPGSSDLQTSSLPSGSSGLALAIYGSTTNPTWGTPDPSIMGVQHTFSTAEYAQVLSGSDSNFPAGPVSDLGTTNLAWATWAWILIRYPKYQQPVADSSTFGTTPGNAVTTNATTNPPTGNVCVWEDGGTVDDGGGPPALQDNSANYAVDTGSADAYAVALDPAIAAYVAGMCLSFKAANANTGASTLAVNGLTAKTIKKSVTDDLASGDILANQLCVVIYDGTNWQLVSTIPPILATVVYPYDLVASYVGSPADGATVFLMTFARTVNFSADFSGSEGKVGVNPTATATYTVYKNGGSVGTIQIDTSGNFTFSTSGSPVSFASGDEMKITAPSPADASLSDIAITLAGTR